MIPPFPIFSAVKNRDWIVALISAVTIILRIVTVVSTGLIKLTPTDITLSEVPISLHNSFITSTNDPTGTQTLAWDILAGVAAGNRSYPAGISHGFAYQNFSTEQPNVNSVTATVDAFYASLNCFSITLDDLRWADAPRSNATLQNITVDRMTLTVEKDDADCPLNITLTNPPLNADEGQGCLLDPICDNLTQPIYVGTFQQAACGVTNPIPMTGLANSSLVALFYTIAPLSSKSWHTALTELSGVVCKPSYAIERVDVTASPAGVQNVSPVNPASPRTIEGIEASDIYSIYWASANPVTREGGNLFLVDAAFEVALGLEYGRSFPSVSHLLSVHNLQNLTENFFTQFGATLAHSAFMKVSQEVATATVTNTQQRLIVSNVAAHLMTGLIAANIVMVFGAMWLVPKSGFMPMTNGSIIRNTALLSQSDQLLSYLRGTGAASMRSLGEKLPGRYSLESAVSGISAGNDASRHIFRIHRELQDRMDNAAKSRELDDNAVIQKPKHPIALHPAPRIATIVVILGIIIALEFTLRASNQHGGIADVENESETHLAWSVIPALVLAIIAAVLQSADFGSRALAPYYLLSKGATFNALRLNLLDRLVWGVLYEEIRAGLLAALAATLAGLIAAFFTIASASLFVAQSVTFESPTQLSTLSSFNRSGLLATDQRQDQTLLVFQENDTFPAFSYRDLVFPELQLAPSTGNSSSVTGTFPALRARMDCELFDPSRVHVNITADNYFGDLIITASVDNEKCHGGYVSPEDFVGSNTSAPNPDDVTVNVNLLADSYLNETFYYGEVYKAYYDINVLNDSDGINGSCQNSWFYVWGEKKDTGTGPQTVARMPDSLSILKCNESVEIVDTMVHFIGPDLTIDVGASPPSPIESTARAVDAPSHWRGLGEDASGGNLYASLGLTTGIGPMYLAPFFQTITTSRFAAPQDWLGDRASGPGVADAIALHHKIMRAIDMAVSRRVPAALSDVLAAAADPGAEPDGGTDDDARDYDAALLTTRRRVVQDVASTRVLQAILGASAVLSLIAWVLMPNTKLLPRDVTSIASLAALLADGDIVRRLPADSAWITDQGLDTWLGSDTKFCISWEGNVSNRGVGQEERMSGASDAAHADMSRPVRQAVGATDRKFGIWAENR